MNKILNRTVWLIALAPVAYLAFVWNNLPETISLHFDSRGNADRYGNRKELLVIVLFLFTLSVLVYYLFTNIYRIDPKKYAVENKGRLQRIGFAVSVFMAAITTMIIYSGIQGNSRLDISLIAGGIGLLFAIIGNYMPNMKPNYFAGFRLPWTLENADNWKKTHALAGKLWFAGGLLLAVVCLLTPAKISFIIFISVIAIITAIPIIYSYRLHKKQKMLNASTY